jgi:hypothetical protein
MGDGLDPDLQFDVSESTALFVEIETRNVAELLERRK